MLACLVASIATIGLQSAVEFNWNADHLTGIYVNGACILGEDVHTNGIYLIGSADGSDAQGHSIISVGSARGRMKSDDPAHISPPPFQLKFRQQGANTLAFSATVGPADQNFEALSLPFDFGRKMMDRFAFDGDAYELFSSENDGQYLGSGNTYDFIRPKAEIRDIHQTLIGKVGGASTNAPSRWGEVDGPYATVRVTVTGSEHYEKLVFFNHPGTHNMEFGLSKLRKGQTASITGIITVTPKAGPNSWTYEAAPEFYHQIGRAEADGWSVRVGDEAEHYMCFGPYAREIGFGARVATFNLMLDNVVVQSPAILTIDVAEATTGAVLAKRDLFRSDFAAPMQYQGFPLQFIARPGAKLEFRTLWHGVSYARQRDVVVTR